MFSRFFRNLRHPHRFDWLRSRSAPIARSSRRLIVLGSVPAGYLVLSNTDSWQEPSLSRQPLQALVRSYVVYSLCSVPALVDYAPNILDTLRRVPLLNKIVYGLVKVTFFDQFVGGETASMALPLLHALRAANKGALFAYSVEVDEKEALGSNSISTSRKAAQDKPHHKRVVDEIISCIDVAADFEDSIRGAGRTLSPYLHEPSYLGLGTARTSSSRRTWVAIKVTALLPDAHALINLSKYITEQRQSGKGTRETQGTANLPYTLSRPTTRSNTQTPASSPSTVVKVQDVPFPGCPLLSDIAPILLPTTTNPTEESRSTRSDAMRDQLSSSDIQHLRELHDDLMKICARAEQRGVRIILDAEYSWYQPALDALTLSLMRQFNALPSEVHPHSPISQPQPLVYATYQAYLRRVPQQLAFNLNDAKENNYALGVKLVRGAYHPYEIASHVAARNGETVGSGKSVLSISPEPLPPVWLEKWETDKAYDDCARVLIGAVKENITRERDGSSINRPGATVGVLFGTHNRASCDLVINELVNNGLGEVFQPVQGHGHQAKVKIHSDVVDRIAIAQLYGMRDDLTDSLASRIMSDVPMAIKYIPYGALEEVLPYLSRRAIENKSVLGDGAAALERRRAFREITNRLKDMVSFT